MSAYIRSLLIAGTVFSVLSAALPLRKNGLAPYVKYVMALALILVMVLPLRQMACALGGAVESLEDLFGGRSSETDEQAAADVVLQETAAHLAESIATLLSERYDMERDGLCIEVTVDGSEPENVKIQSVCVTADKLPPLLTAAYLGSYLSELLGCPVTVS